MVLSRPRCASIHVDPLSHVAVDGKEDKSVASNGGEVAAVKIRLTTVRSPYDPAHSSRGLRKDPLRDHLYVVAVRVSARLLLACNLHLPSVVLVKGLPRPTDNKRLFTAQAWFRAW